MKPLRRHVALAVDGGGIRGAMVTRALTMLEAHLGTPCHVESYGQRLGPKLLNDELDHAQFVTALPAPTYRQPEPTDLLKPEPSRPSSLPL